MKILKEEIPKASEECEFCKRVKEFEGFIQKILSGLPSVRISTFGIKAKIPIAISFLLDVKIKDAHNIDGNLHFLDEAEFE